MAETLTINRPDVLQALGRGPAELFSCGDRFELTGRNWHASVRKLPMARHIEDGCSLRFEVAESARPDRPVLVVGPHGLQVLGSVLPGYQLLALAFGIEWPDPKGSMP